jgi:hypothetical protein
MEERKVACSAIAAVLVIVINAADGCQGVPPVRTFRCRAEHALIAPLVTREML